MRQLSNNRFIFPVLAVLWVLFISGVLTLYIGTDRELPAVIGINLLAWLGGVVFTLMILVYFMQERDGGN